MFFMGVTFILLIIASILDIRKKVISIWMLLMLCTVAVCFGAVELYDGMTTVGELMLSLLPGSLMLAAALLSRQRLGIGDGLLALCIGPIFGPRLLLAGACLAFLLSALFSIVLLVLRRGNRHTGIPFIPFLTSAMGVVTLATF